MLAVGVDLAAEPKKTAIALIDWSPGKATVVGLDVGVRDERIVDAAANCQKLGIDCPLGRPVPFVEFIASHHNGHVVVPATVAGLAWRRQLAFRTTDAAVRERTAQRLIPLSVAADRIGHTAMRCAALLAALALRGMQVDRAGTGL
jgi:predicted nuclease with RNAse H fold